MVTHSAGDVAAEIRRRVPNVPVKKLHKLLYYCQGHHLAWFGEPLFGETIEAWDRGPVVADLWRSEKHGQPLGDGAPLTNTELNTIGYVVSRYGHMTGGDLEALTHNEAPWRDADHRRRHGGRQLMPIEEIAAYFTTPRQFDQPDPDDPADDLYARAADQIHAILAGAAERSKEPARPDSRDAILALAK